MFSGPEFSGLSTEQLEYAAAWELTNPRPEIESVLKAHLMVEALLERLITAKLVNPKSIFRPGKMRSFEFKVDLAHALGVLPDAHCRVAKRLNNIRNELAHRVSVTDTFDRDSLTPLMEIWPTPVRAAFKQTELNAPKEVVLFAVTATVRGFFFLFRDPT